MKSEKTARLFLAIVGIILVGTGVAFNAAAALGNDPVGMMYDGLRSALGLSSGQLGTASNVVNLALVVIVFLLDRHYVNVGTLIYIVPYGTVVTLSGQIYGLLFPVQTLPTQILGAALGCTLLYTGVALFITADIGLDPFTGLVMVLRDRVKKEYRVVKVCFDIGCIALGFLLGGKLGVITLLTAATAGPVIQFLSDGMKRLTVDRTVRRSHGGNRNQYS